MDKKIVEAVEKYMKIARTRFFDKNLKDPSIKYTKRGTTAGTATYGENSVNFNMGIYRENEEVFLRTTVPHEVAHLIAYQIFGLNGTGHGKWWKFIMEEVFNVRANRCHSYSVSHHKTRQIRKWKYACKCSTHVVTSVKHFRMEKDPKHYHCIHCKGQLFLVGEHQVEMRKAA